MDSGIPIKLAQKAEIDALNRIASSLAVLPETEKVIFFGSRARGDFVGSSDMDILIILSSLRIKNDVITILHDIELEYDVPISSVVFTRHEFETNKRLNSNFVNNVEREGIVLYDNEHRR